MVLSQLCWVGFHGMTQFYSNTQSMWLLGIFTIMLDQTKQNCRSGFCPGRNFSLFKTLLFEGCKISNFLIFRLYIPLCSIFLGLKNNFLVSFHDYEWLVRFHLNISNMKSLLIIIKFLPHSFLDNILCQISPQDLTE